MSDRCRELTVAGRLEPGRPRPDRTARDEGVPAPKRPQQYRDAANLLIYPLTAASFSKSAPDGVTSNATFEPLLRPHFFRNGAGIVTRPRVENFTR